MEIKSTDDVTVQETASQTAFVLAQRRLSWVIQQIEKLEISRDDIIDWLQENGISVGVAAAKQHPYVGERMECKAESIAVDTGNICAIRPFVDDLGLSARPYNALRRAGIDSIWQIVNIEYADLKKVRGLGEKSIVEIICAIHNFMLTMKWEPAQKGERDADGD